MKKLSIFFAAITIILLPNFVPLHAEESEQTDVTDQRTQQKNECMLVARNCGNSVISIQDKIDKLKDEIAKGRAVYTTEELNILKQKLDDVSRTLDFLLEKK